ncbi:hypothetical protein [Vallicoccus soli]|uniref:AbiEi antitoxin C-terminal domain-containing protein n=1 Tax=Vallicoccus soli TaxID=2339232 RepID=A0A3A3Z0L9_9ACTN|nr:hypothetical protein [Vallicoccus soli]RJK97800.1 hypothetical protein D5H78_02095 [Vallicoccus soli]
MPAAHHAYVPAVAALLASGQHVVTRSRLLALGMSSDTIRHHVTTADDWQWLLPGTYLLRRGTPTWHERATAALAYAGPGALLSGGAAAHLHGAGDRPEALHVLVPHARRRKDCRFVRVERTRRLPDPVDRSGLAVAPLARALADACRASTAPRSTRALVVAAVQRGCPLDALRRELEEGPIKHSALLRSVLEEVGAGVRSIAEVDARRLVRRARLPEPLWNADLLDLQGRFLARPDGYWPEVGVAWQIDSREWHTSAEDWERTLRRHAALASRGVLVLHTLPSQVRTDEAAVLAELARTLESGRGRPVPAVVVAGLQSAG